MPTSCSAKVANGIALSISDHAAFDNHLIQIPSDGRVHLSERLLMLHHGLLREQSLRAITGMLIRARRSERHRPDRNRLANRFEQFKRAARCRSVRKRVEGTAS